MMGPAAAQSEFTPLFDWSAAHGRKISLLSFISASALLHVLCFYLFQIVYPPTVALVPPPARVNIITAASEEGRSLLQWIDAEDPALSSTTQRAPDASFSLPAPEYVPSYVSRKPALREPPPYEPDLRVPSSQPPAPVPLTRGAKPAPPSATPTELSFTDELHPMTPLPASALRFTASTKEPPQAAQFRVGICSRGDVRYCFLQRSSGDPALDEQARRALLLCRFSPFQTTAPQPESDLIWTTATFEWGNDITAPPPTSIESPAP